MYEHALGSVRDVEGYSRLFKKVKIPENVILSIAKNLAFPTT